MKKLIAISLIAISATNALAALQPWEDPRVNEVGREPMHAAFFAFEPENKSLQKKESSRFLNLDGKWLFHWVADADKCLKDKFYMPL